MSWTFSDDVAEYARASDPLLTAAPEEHTVALTNIANQQAAATGLPRCLYGWYSAGGGPVTGAVSLTPGYPLLISVLPGGAEASLVDGLVGLDIAPIGLFGEPDAVRRLADCWTAANGGQWREHMRERLYRLDELQVPEAAGRARRAVMEDGELILGWVAEFIAETGVDHAPPPRHLTLGRIEQGLAWLWLNEVDEPAAMALRNRPAAGVSRVGPVYTPPSHRRRGFGAAVTAACTADAIAAGVSSVVLFTDLANPTSNSIYQQIGYRQLSDRLVCTFTT